MGRPDPRPPSGSETDPREWVLAPVRTARDELAAERAEVAAERRALDAFVDRVTSLSTVSTVSRARTDGPVPGDGAVATGTNARAGADLLAVRSAYRETVMAVDHYEAAYGDDLAESLAAEFGPELAVAVGEGAGGALTPQLRDALVEAAESSRDDRATFLDTLDGEAASLRTAATAFEDLLDRTIEPGNGNENENENENGPGAAADGAIDESVIDRLEAVTAGRQERLHRQPGLRRMDGHDLCSYLYGGADWTYPVLAAAARCRAVLPAET